MNKVLCLLFLSLTLLSCSKEDENYSEATLVIASERLTGVYSSCGMNGLGLMYAVKYDDDNDWSRFQGSIGGFNYEPGYEYKIRIGITHYLDYNMSTPAWSEYELVEILSKEKKDSESLPKDFIPDWWNEQSGKE